jgi:hypothetical protein
MLGGLEAGQRRGVTIPPVRFLEHLPLDEVAEALRRQPRRSERVLEVYSPLALKPVSKLVSLTSTSSGPPCPRGSLVRADII